MNEGYVVFVNEHPIYLSLANILVESVLSFSSKPIEVFSINFDYKHSNSRVLNRRINLNNVTFETICYSKLYSSLNSSFDYGIQLDSDFIITKKMDLLFEDARKVGLLPLGSLHPQDPENQQEIMNHLGVVKKSQPYIHATYLFSKESKPFLKECYDISQNFLKKRIVPPNYDETILNVMLWKHNATEWVSTYDIYYEIFLKGFNPPYGGYPSNFNLNFYSCHGLKDPSQARDVLNNLIKSEQK